MVENEDEKNITDDVKALDKQNSEKEEQNKGHEKEPAIERVGGDAIEQMLMLVVQGEEKMGSGEGVGLGGRGGEVLSSDLRLGRERDGGRGM